MNVEKNLDGTTLNVIVEGRLDTATAPDLEKEVKESLEGVTKLVIDFEKLEYISSAGLRVLLSLHKLMKQQMVIRGSNEVVMDVFEVTGFSDILNLE